MGGLSPQRPRACGPRAPCSRCSGGVGLRPTEAAGPDGPCLAGVPEGPVQAEAAAMTPDAAALCRAESTSKVLTRSLVSGETRSGPAPLSACGGPRRPGLAGPPPTDTTSLANAPLPGGPVPPSGRQGVRRRTPQGTWRCSPGPRGRLAGRSPVWRRRRGPRRPAGPGTQAPRLPRTGPIPVPAAQSTGHKAPARLRSRGSGVPLTGRRTCTGSQAPGPHGRPESSPGPSPPPRSPVPRRQRPAVTLTTAPTSTSGSAPARTASRGLGACGGRGWLWI